MGCLILGLFYVLVNGHLFWAYRRVGMTKGQKADVARVSRDMRLGRWFTCE